MASSPAVLTRSRSAPQPITALAPSAPASKAHFIQRSVSHVDVDKKAYERRRLAAQTTKMRQEFHSSSLAVSPPGDPFSLSGFFPTSLYTIGSEAEEWQWLREEGGKEGEKYQEYQGDGEGPVRDGRSAIFSQETSEAIKGEDKLGVLSLKDVSLFSASAGERDYRLMSPYASDEVVDETALYLAQKARREESEGLSAVGGSGYGDLFLAE